MSKISELCADNIEPVSMTGLESWQTDVLSVVAASWWRYSLRQPEVLQCPLTSQPDIESIKFFLQRSVNLVTRKAVDVLLNEAPPTEWQETALLRHHRLIRLNEHGEQRLGDCLFYAYPELGVVIQSSVRAAGAGRSTALLIYPINKFPAENLQV